MKAADFIYHRASSINEAIGYLDDYNGEARLLAGGQSLVPMMNMRLWRPAALIDINEIPELASFEDHGDVSVVGAMTRYVTIERSPFFAERLPLLARLVRHIGDRQIRNRGTIGGSLVQGDPSSEMALGCMALGARVRIVGRLGQREVTMNEFYHGSYAAAVEPGEIVTAIIFPKHPRYHAFHEVGRRHNDFAVLSVVACGNRSPEGVWSDVVLGLGGVHETAILVRDVAPYLEGSRFTDREIEGATISALKSVEPPSDMRASEEYRRHLVSVYVPRVLQKLRSLAQHNERP